MNRNRLLLLLSCALLAVATCALLVERTRSSESPPAAGTFDAICVDDRAVLFHAGLAFSHESINVSSLAECIRDGMTEAEVVAIIGRPPGDYTTRRDVGYASCDAILGESLICAKRRGEPREWLFNTGSITVWFEDGKVDSLEFGNALRKLTWLEKMLRVELFPLREPAEWCLSEDLWPHRYGNWQSR